MASNSSSMELSMIGAAPLVDARDASAHASAPALPETLSEHSIQTDALESEPGLETERQRRLGSFELLDAAMDNVVEHDASDDVDDEHVIPDISVTASRINDADSDRPLLADAHALVSDTQAMECDAGVEDDDATHAAASMREPVDPSELLHADTASEAAATRDESTPVAAAAVVPPHTEPSLAHAAVTSASLSSRLKEYEPELLEWLRACQVADHGLPATHDDVLFFLESKDPELLEHTDVLFAWLAHFRVVDDASSSSSAAAADDGDDASSAASDLSRLAHQSLDRFSDAFKLSALARLEQTGSLTDVANEFGLKSTTTLEFWQYQREHARALVVQPRPSPSSSLSPAQPAATAPSTVMPVPPPSSNATAPVHELGRKTGGFAQEQGLLAWVLSHRESPITKQDIFNYMVASYPEYAATRTAAALKMWIARFLKRHVSPAMASSTDVLTALPVRSSTDGVEPLRAQDATGPSESSVVAAGGAGVLPAPSALSRPLEPPAPLLPLADSTSAPPDAASSHPKRRAKRGCPDGYVLHSNEFKLNALRKLDEGKSMSEVTTELGLKSQNTLAYWHSIRDKLATSEKKRYRLAGGGRRSSCTFEDELLTWVAERHQRGQGTDVRAVLDYMREAHPAFTDGKKEPTLRKWILRFFKRCWRTPSVTAGSNSSNTDTSSSSSTSTSSSSGSSSTSDVDKAFIFV